MAVRPVSSQRENGRSSLKGLDHSYELGHVEPTLPAFVGGNERLRLANSPANSRWVIPTHVYVASLLDIAGTEAAVVHRRAQTGQYLASDPGKLETQRLSINAQDSLPQATERAGQPPAFAGAAPDLIRGAKTATGGPLEGVAKQPSRQVVGEARVRTALPGRRGGAHDPDRRPGLRNDRRA